MVGDEKRTIRFHDYHEIYEVPGLYEHIFHDHLECASPEEVIGLLAEQLVAAEVDPATLAALDVGAGNGLVGEQIAAPRRARRSSASTSSRRRPRLPRATGGSVYDDYIVCDLTALDDDQRARLGTPTLMTTVAALGFDDIPPEAFSEAYGGRRRRRVDRVQHQGRLPRGERGDRLPRPDPADGARRRARDPRDAAATSTRRAQVVDVAGRVDRLMGRSADGVDHAGGIRMGVLPGHKD